MTPEIKHYPIALECEHQRWFKPPLPDPGEHIWCTTCQKYSEVAPIAVTMGRAYQEDFWSEPYGRNGRYRGGCTVCDDFERTAESWNALRLRMHNHYMQKHTRFGATLVIEVQDQLPRNNPPPF